ncbi:MAG TPA: hypothetical protein VFI28_07910, partial [Candidatus Limnocylindrales bacterium]|nr:hypothetical protein [Candidatus Limnocylindrales bacterium]
ALDLAFFLPACVVAAVGLFRGMAVRVLAPPLLVFAALIGAESLGGFLFTAAAGEEVPVPVAVVLGVVALVAAALAWVALRPTGTPNAGVEPRSATVDSVDADHAWAGLGLALGAGIGAGLGIVAAVVLSLDVASGIVAGAAVGVIVGLLGGASVERGRS